MNIFRFWKKKSKDVPYEKELLVNVCHKLYDRFPFLYEQLEAGIVHNIKIDDDKRKIQFDIDVLSKYENKKGRYFAIENIEIYDSQGNVTLMYIHVGYGIIISYGFDNPIFNNECISNVNVQNIRIVYFDDDEQINQLLTKQELARINPADVYELELEGFGTIYHLIDVADGDFIGIDKNKNIYLVNHDPYEIRKLNGSLIEILEDYQI